VTGLATTTVGMPCAKSSVAAERAEGESEPAPGPKITRPFAPFETAAFMSVASNPSDGMSVLGGSERRI